MRAPTHVVVRIDEVVVAATQPNGRPWDGDVVAPREGEGCSIFGKAIGLALATEVGAFASLVSEGASLLCRGASRPSQRQNDPTNPDLQVRIGTADGTPYVTEVAPDVTQTLFGRRFVLPIDAIPPDGLIIEVVDDDLAAGRQQIGAVRVSRNDVLRALNEPTQLLVRDQKPSLLKLELVISEYGAHPNTNVDMSAREGTHPDVADVMGGEVVSITASGKYRVGTWYDADVSPVGYPGGGPRDYNFKYEPLRSAAHACGFALVGERDRTAALVDPSASFVAPTPGPLLVGINDSDPTNNSGSIQFTITQRAPTASEWRLHRPSR